MCHLDSVWLRHIDRVAGPVLAGEQRGEDDQSEGQSEDKASLHGIVKWLLVPGSIWSDKVKQ